MKYQDRIRALETVAAARVRVMRSLDDGIECPCCSQYCRLYKRKLNVTMALSLISLVRVWKRTQDWVNIKDIPLRDGDARVAGGELAKLSHWRLIEQMRNDDPSKRCSGMWRPTRRGVDFVHRRISVPSHVHLYNNEVMGFSDDSISIEAALGEGFDYAELMGYQV